MSMFSGKCDFYDEIEIFGLDRILKAKVYIGDKLLQLNSLRDCIPYYPYIVMSAAYKINGQDLIRLSDKSWIDMEAEKYGETTIHELYRNKLKEEIDKYEKTN